MSVTRHTLYNLAGTAVPIAVALVTIPIYISVIGEERYGVLSIVWLFLGYFGVFDLGIGRAVAQRTAGEVEHSIARTVRTAACLNLTFGLAGATVLFPVASYYFAEKFVIAESLRQEVLTGIPWLMLALPVATSLSVLNGYLQGVQKFRVLNTVNASNSVMFQLMPLLVAVIYSTDLRVLLPVAIITRASGVVYLVWYIRRDLLKTSAAIFNWQEAKSLLSFGGWVSVSSLISPIMVMADRFVIGALLGARFVGLYAVAYQIAERTTILSTALASSAFPTLVTMTEEGRYALCCRSISALTAITLPAYVVLALLAQSLLGAWISVEFAQQVAPAFHVLLCAFFVNGLARIPHALLLASNRPKWVALSHTSQVLPFLVALYYLTQQFGLPGAAVAFGLRVLADNFILSYLGRLFSKMVIPALLGILVIGAAGYLTGRGGFLESVRIPGIILVALMTMGISLWFMPKHHIHKLLKNHTGNE